MATRKKRSNKRKSNPSTAQLVVLGIGGTVGLGLLGYGIYLAVKKSKPEIAGGFEGSGGPLEPSGYWEYVIFQEGPIYRANVWPPGGDAIPLAPAANRAAATSAVVAYIKGRGGIPVARS